MKKQARCIRTAQENIEAMTIIINIQTMQDKIYGKRFEYDDFNANTVEELRNLQSQLISEWNKAVTNQ